MTRNVLSADLFDVGEDNILVFRRQGGGVAGKLTGGGEVED